MTGTREYSNKEIVRWSLQANRAALRVRYRLGNGPSWRHGGPFSPPSGTRFCATLFVLGERVRARPAFAPAPGACAPPAARRVHPIPFAHTHAPRHQEHRPHCHPDCGASRPTPRRGVRALHRPVMNGHAERLALYGFALGSQHRLDVTRKPYRKRHGLVNTAGHRSRHSAKVASIHGGRGERRTAGCLAVG